MNQSNTPSEDRVRESEELFRLIVESAQDFGIFTQSLERRIVTWNNGARRITGFDESEVVGRSSDIIFIPEDRASGKPELEARMALAEGKAEDERWHLRKDGTRFWGSGQLILLRDEAGAPRGFAKILRDRTDRKRAEQRVETALRAMEASEERSRLLTEEVRDYGIYMLDTDGLVVTWNAGAERLKGYRKEDIIGRHFSRFFTEEDVRAGVPDVEIREAAERGRAGREGWRVRKDGTMFWANEVMTAIRCSEGQLRGFTKITRDLTQRKQAEDELRRAHDELEARVQERTAELSRALATLERESAERARIEQSRRELLRRLVTVQEDERRRIARELHDELGQHMTAISLELKVLADTIPEDHPSRKRLVRAQTVTGQLGGEVHRLALELRPTALDDLGLNTTLINYLDSWSERSGIAVDYHAPGLDDARPPSHVETTAYRIVQEALTNVVKHAEASRVSVVVERREHGLHLIVEDNGRGFDDREVAEVKAPTGRLGILGMKERVAMVGGTLTIESRPGGPTTLFVRVPTFETGKATSHG